MVRTSHSYGLIPDKSNINDLQLKTLTKYFEDTEPNCSSRDERIDLVPIASGLKELLFEAGISIEYLLDNDALKISEILGIDESVVSLIKRETTKLVQQII